MILKIIFKINFLFANLHDRGICRRPLGLSKDGERLLSEGTLPISAFLQAPQTRIEEHAEAGEVPGAPVPTVDRPQSLNTTRASTAFTASCWED